MSAQTPVTPPRSRGMATEYDPETTPTRHRPSESSWPPMVKPHGFSRKKSWEEDSVTSLADPRDFGSLAYGEIWKDDFVQGSKAAFADFHNNLKMEFLPLKAQSYRRMHRALTKKGEDGFSDLAAILREASLLFAGYPDLALSLNHCLPPGYTLEATEDYVSVITPMGAWRQYPDGRRVDYAAIPSSSR
ncbi:hypothetical protein L226DRAFT_562177 [Lentinus tigrinus ALCF2SS1-7]|uniref:Uncharacterized protein n=1 Tax=Lentinus tigrinus ALCF2SS1-6 TaxID=1328759 RepID=A0A5C2S0V1_9APHY|nr:hypothetical protein L227DRAFT_602728 [Lentinus tigrinus ALCF2SS1-6]RPD71778.1 hypothetical protein L226DRAFT_562177 [Lentinus tigrinus ALCF2SS1-7]